MSLVRSEFGKTSIIQQSIELALKISAEEKGVKPLPKEKFITSDGEPYLIAGQGLSRFKSLDSGEEDVVNERARLQGKYSTNNGMVSAVDADGALLVAPYTDEVMSILKDLDYKEASNELPVPFSNGQKPVRPDIAKKLETMRREAEVEIVKKSTKHYVDECEDNARHEDGSLPKAISEVEGYLMKIDGIVYCNGVYDENSQLEVLSSVGRTKAAGHYSESHGFVAVVDTKGSMYLGKRDDATIKSLQDAGYRSSSFDVPLSNGGMPLGWQGQMIGTGACAILEGGVDTTLMADFNDKLGCSIDTDFVVDSYQNRTALKL